MRAKKEETGEPALAFELPNGEKSTGKRTQNSLALQPLPFNEPSKSADIAKEVKLIEPEEMLSQSKVLIDHIGSRNPRLHSNEILILHLLTATENPDAARAIWKNSATSKSEAHTQPSS